MTGYTCHNGAQSSARLTSYDHSILGNRKASIIRVFKPSHTMLLTKLPKTEWVEDWKKYRLLKQVNDESDAEVDIEICGNHLGGDF